MTRDFKLMMASLFLWGVGEGLFIYLYPLYLEKLGANAVTIGSIMSLTAVALAAAHIPAGWLADRFGRKEVMVAGWLMACLAVLAMYLAPDLKWFTLGLVLYMFTGYVISPMSAYVTEARGTLSVSRALTLNVAGYAAGTLFSPALGGQIARALGLRAVFGIALGVLLLSLWVLLMLRHQPAAAPPAGVNRYRTLLANSRFVGLMLLSFAAAMAFQVGFPLAQNFLADVRGFDAGLVGLLGSFNALGITVLNMAVGQRAPRGTYILSQALMAFSLVVLLSTGSVGWIALAFFCRGSWSLARMMTNAQVGQVVDRPELGLAYGVAESVVALSMIFGPLAAGVLYARAPSLPFQFGLGLLALTAPLMWRFAPRLRPQPGPGAGACGPAEDVAPPQP
jgi:predicted MFS family arabinose efflux permease